MHKNITLTPDKLTIIIENKEIDIPNVISANKIATEILIPIIQVYEERSETKFYSLAAKPMWINRRFAIIFDIKNNRILVQLRGAFFLSNDEPIVKINKAIDKARELQLDFHITEVDYQYTFKTKDQKGLYKSFLKSNTAYKKTENEEKGFTIAGYGKNIELLDSYSIFNSIYAVKLYNKSKQLKKLDERIKNETITKYGEQDNIIRLELSYTRKSATVKKLNIELLEQKEIGTKTLTELLNPFDKFKFNKTFLKKLTETV